MKNSQKVAPKVDFNFAPIIEIIIASSNEEASIRKEFEKAKKFFSLNPEMFIETLLSTKSVLECMPYLTPTEENALLKIYNLLDAEEMDVESYFVFVENFLLNDMTKIYRQITEKFASSIITENDEMEILFYSVDERLESDSKLCLNKFTILVEDFLLTYQMGYN